MADTEEVKKRPKSFEALTPELSSWILDYTQSMNFARTTPVQGMAIPLLMGNKDLVVEVPSDYTSLPKLVNVDRWCRLLQVVAKRLLF